MITENLSTLKINKLTQEQYDRELAAGRIDENALYLTPDDTESQLEDIRSQIANIPVLIATDDGNGNISFISTTYPRAEEVLY